MSDEPDVEPILEPDLPIIDAHHHLWHKPPAAIPAMEADQSISTQVLLPIYRAKSRYLFEDFLADIGSGHNVQATVYVQAHAMYRATGPELFKSVGEIEFANGIAAMAASGLFGNSLICAGIVGGVDLRIGERVEELLEAHIAAGNGRYRGVRSSIVFDEDMAILGKGVNEPGILLDERFRAGFRRLEKFGLSFEAWLFEPQLPELVDLARTFPATQIIVNHVGAPLLLGRFKGKRMERFPIWQRSIRALAACPNVTVKLGGLGIPFGDFPSYLSEPRFSSLQLAAEWKPYIETCIEAFGADRCMFESNFPVDWAAGSYKVIWNAFKRITNGASDGEKRNLYYRTAARIYRLSVPELVVSE